MPELDRLKEQIAYLKFWQGIMVVTDISLVGWIITAPGEEEIGIVVVGLLGVVLIAIGVLILHREIGRRITKVGDL